MTREKIREEYNMRFFSNWISSFAGSEIIDIGCGTGEFALDVVRFGAHCYVGVDLQDSTNWVKLKDKNIYFARGTIGDLPFRDGTFDIAILKEVLHHLDRNRIKNAISKVLNLLKENGKLFIIESNRYNPIGYFHMVVFRKHNHLKQRDFIDFVDGNSREVSFRYMESHYWPISNRFLRSMLYKFEGIISKICLLRPFLSVNIAIIKK